MAIGASGSQISRMILVEASRVIGVGSVIGFAIAFVVYFLLRILNRRST